MQLKQTLTSDLRSLSRESDAPPPAIPPPRFAWKTRLLLPALILLSLALLVGYTVRDVLFPPLAVEVVPVVLKSIADAGVGGAVSAAGTSVRSGTPVAGSTVQAPGWVEPDPFPIAVTALAGGVVQEVLVLEGDSVKAGDVVVRMVDDDAELALARAEAELAEKEAALNGAQRQWDNPIERTRAVAVAEATVEQTKAHIEKHHAEVLVEQAKLAQAREEFDRVQGSAKSRAVSEIEVIRARQALAAQEATLKATSAELQIFQADLSQRTAELNAARENLRLRIEETQALAGAKASHAMARAALDEAVLRLQRMQVRSPVDGIVMQRLVEIGSRLSLDMDDPRSAQAARLYDPKKLQVRVDVPLADAAKVGIGMKAQITVGVLPDRSFHGTVTRIVNEADIQKNTLQVKVAITDPSPELKPEMLARVRFSGSSTPAGNGDSGAAAGAATALFAPLALLHRPGGGRDATAWVFDPGAGVAMHKAVVLGTHQQDGWVAVTAGLSPGDQLIAADHDRLVDGQRVRVVGEADLSAPAAGGIDHGTH